MLSIIAGSASAWSGSSLINDFNAWKVTHAKSYATTDLEAGALAAFSSNDAIIKESNTKGLSYLLGHNEFSDMTWEQFQGTVMGDLYTNVAPKNMNRVHIRLGQDQSANATDWVTKGGVTPIKNQGHCGSCWAFSSTGSIEGQLFATSGKLTSVSEEQLVQCDHHNPDNGCKGGLMDSAFTWIAAGNALATEAEYPYTSGSGITGTCNTAAPKGSVMVTGHKDVPTLDEDALKDAVEAGPVSVAIEADKSAFQLYKSGVFDSTACGKQLDHGVLVVGYGTDTGKDYWKVKNSWGQTWGDMGYIRMVRGKNMCGIATQPSYPTGVSQGPAPPGPSPGPSPPSPSPPSPAGKSHYSDPKDGCLSDEIEITIQKITGDFCTSKCGIFKACPTDVPAGVTAKPTCALQDASTNQKFCALICSPTLPILDQKAADSQCGTAGTATCKAAGQGVGLCTYND